MEFKTLEILTTRALGPLDAEVTLSSEAVDREGDVIAASGWNVDSYLRNPVVLLHHDHKSLPVAKMDRLTVTGDKLVGRLKFPPGVSARADEARALLKEGFLSGVSVGFRPIRSEPRKGGGTHYVESELLELSLVSVPANDDALVTAKGAGKAECPRGRACASSATEGRDGRCPAAECPMFAGLPTKDIAEAIASVAPELAREAAEQFRAAMTAAQMVRPMDRGVNLFTRVDLTSTPQSRALDTLVEQTGLSEAEIVGAVIDGLRDLKRTGELQRIVTREVMAANRALWGR